MVFVLMVLIMLKIVLILIFFLLMLYRNCVFRFFYVLFLWLNWKFIVL